MKVFNEESVKATELILMLKPKEVRTLIDGLAEGCKNRPRKISWKKLLKQLETEAGVYSW